MKNIFFYALIILITTSCGKSNKNASSITDQKNLIPASKIDSTIQNKSDSVYRSKSNEKKENILKELSDKYNTGTIFCSSKKSHIYYSFQIDSIFDSNPVQIIKPNGIIDIEKGSKYKDCGNTILLRYFGFPKILFEIGLTKDQVLKCIDYKMSHLSSSNFFYIITDLKLHRNDDYNFLNSSQDYLNAFVVEGKLIDLRKIE